MQAVGVLTALHGFWWPDGEGLRRALAIQSAWAPFPRWTTVLAVLVGAGAVLLLVRAVRPAAPAAPVAQGGAVLAGQVAVLDAPGRRVEPSEERRARLWRVADAALAQHAE